MSNNKQLDEIHETPWDEIKTRADARKFAREWCAQLIENFRDSDVFSQTSDGGERDINITQMMEDEVELISRRILRGAR